jgi:PAS domain S-box-containing protein
MLEYLAHWFSTERFMPHGMCLVWRQDLIWLHVISDVLIALSYFSIPFALVYFVRKRTDLAYPWMFLLFAVFILACGTTHFFAAWVMWYPDYVWQGLVKAATAAVSVISAVLLWPLIPKALALPSPAQLALANMQLRESEEKFRCLSENALDAIVMADAEGNVRFWNSAAERLFGYRPDEILGRSMHEILTPARYRYKAAASYSQFAKTGTGDVPNKTRELEALRKDGSEFPIELSVSGVQISGAWNGIAIVHDITERKRLIAKIEYRGRLLHAVSIAAKELLTAAAIDESMAKVLQTIGEAVRVDRMLVFENNTPPGGDPAYELRFAWHSAHFCHPEFTQTLVSRRSTKGKPFPCCRGPCLIAQPRPIYKRWEPINSQGPCNHPAQILKLHWL